MVFLWFFYGFPLVFLWFSYGFPMVLLWFNQFPLVFLGVKTPSPRTAPGWASNPRGLLGRRSGDSRHGAEVVIMVGHILLYMVYIYGIYGIYIYGIYGIYMVYIYIYGIYRQEYSDV